MMSWSVVTGALGSTASNTVAMDFTKKKRQMQRGPLYTHGIGDRNGDFFVGKLVRPSDLVYLIQAAITRHGLQYARCNIVDENRLYL